MQMSKTQRMIFASVRFLFVFAAILYTLFVCAYAHIGFGFFPFPVYTFFPAAVKKGKRSMLVV